MYIRVNKEMVEKFQAIPGLSEGGKAYLDEMSEYRYGSEYELLFNKFTEDDLQKLYDLAQAETNRSVMMQIKPFLNYKKKKNSKVTNITTFAAILEDYLRQDADRFWVYRRVAGNQPYLLAYFVYSIKYESGDRKENPASVTVTLKASSISRYDYSSIVFHTEDLGDSVENILLKQGYLHEDPSLLEEYLKDQNAFMVLSSKGHIQVEADGLLQTRARWDVDDIVGKTKGIIDMPAAERSFKTAVSSKFWTGKEEPYHMPVHPFIHMFSLTHHTFMNVHIRNVKEYVYDDSLKDKLVLPETHRDLLDILVSDVDILKGDIIEGKSTGTTILCKGIPGTGKTLTAEAYSEISHKPLYKVSSGQLGVTAGDVEKNLQTILTRAERYNAIMLIDEADTYIRQRGNDISHNAIVAAFLRTLEYFNGILFLTTNRSDDIDDAIDSRCIATIIYEVPVEEDAKKIWKILSREFSNELPDSMISQLVKIFPKCTGRDIKELTKLTFRYANAKGRKADVGDFVSCAKFRAVTIDKKALEDYKQLLTERANPVI